MTTDKLSHTSTPGDIFATTHWTVVLAAGRRHTPQSDRALEELCRTYWFPLYAYVRRRGHNKQDAEDSVQAFFARFLAKNYLATRLQRMLDSLLNQRQRDKTIWTLQPGFDPRLNARQDSFCFKTSKGTVGILQIVNAEDNPAGLRVRYKLVQNAETQKPKTDSLVGQVVDQNGKPLANVRWRISAVEEWRAGQWELIHKSGIPQWAFTDAEGRFTLTIQGRQRFDLQFDGGEFAPAFVYEVSPDTNNLKVFMKPGIPARGTVIASNSNRIPGNVRVELMLPCRDVWYQQEEITDADGHFTFYVCAPPTEPNKAFPSKWQISCAGTVTPFDVTTEKTIGMNLLVDARAEVVVDTNAPVTK